MKTFEVKTTWGINVFIIDKITLYGYSNREEKDTKMYIESIGVEANELTFNTKKERDEVFNALDLKIRYSEG